MISHKKKQHTPAGTNGPTLPSSAKLLLLLPYSRDFNPIENAFARVKAILRKAAARTMPKLRDAIPQFKPQERANMSKATCYEPE